ncbi:hypothetical protein [Chryseobacterium gambrini]|uniref:hypothetical protein n=1 Tax=Chryseobacterium gambrini TaxID=373672 RepID=UPI0022F156D6|nr:hypothetical protein [Chryseobacterium gambrini]WBV52889.1 hypothetical protein PFY09_00955 [Chryseobacterium gambrini]
MIPKESGTCTAIFNKEQNSWVPTNTNRQKMLYCRRKNKSTACKTGSSGLQNK